jgi:hypothetical protein
MREPLQSRVPTPKLVGDVSALLSIAISIAIRCSPLNEEEEEEASSWGREVKESTWMSLPVKPLS